MPAGGAGVPEGGAAAGAPQAGAASAQARRPSIVVTGCKTAGGPGGAQSIGNPRSCFERCAAPPCVLRGRLPPRCCPCPIPLLLLLSPAAAPPAPGCPRLSALAPAPASGHGAVPGAPERDRRPQGQLPATRRRRGRRLARALAAARGGGVQPARGPGQGGDQRWAVGPRGAAAPPPAALPLARRRRRCWVLRTPSRLLHHPHPPARLPLSGPPPPQS